MEKRPHNQIKVNQLEPLDLLLTKVVVVVVVIYKEQERLTNYGLISQIIFKSLASLQEVKRVSDLRRNL